MSSSTTTTHGFNCTVRLAACVGSKPTVGEKHKLYGKSTDGYHARSTPGFAALPAGDPAELEANFEILS